MMKTNYRGILTSGRAQWRRKSLLVSASAMKYMSRKREYSDIVFHRKYWCSRYWTPQEDTEVKARLATRWVGYQMSSKAEEATSRYATPESAMVI
jgi:hypothetical protein